MTTTHVPGSYVTHAKLPELGSGEVIFLEKGTMRIRFASGERNFFIDAVQPHLVVTQVAPARPPLAKRVARKPKAAKKS